ncbi:MAG: phospholipase D-like domain-containing protein [Thermoanaerobaculia bacterium]
MITRISFLLFLSLTTHVAYGGEYLDALNAAIKKADPNGKYNGSLYHYSTANALPRGWLEHTPKAWGKRPEEVVPFAHSEFFADHIREVISGAEQSVDLSTLYPEPDGYFAGSIEAGLKALAKKGKPITVRILLGNTPAGNFHAVRYLEILRNILKAEPNGKLTIYAGGQRSGAGTWNHSKIVAADGKEAIVGGHNLWPLDYLGAQPVHDVSMRVQGPAAAGAQRFLDLMWKNVCDWNGKGTWPNYSYRWKQGSDAIVQECAPALNPAGDSNPGQVQILGVARAATGVIPEGGDIANPSDVAMLAAMDAAKKSIKLSQQDMLYRLPQIGECTTLIPYKGWYPGYLALARAIGRGVDVQVVVTTWNAKAGNNGTKYSNCITRDEVISYLRGAIRDLRIPDGDKLLHKHFSIATLRFGPGKEWRNGYAFANHAKMMIIDDKLFYIGSSNFYSADLQEYGYFVEDAFAGTQLQTDYWDPLWRWSGATAKP